MEKTILVVDDEQDILDLVVYNLEQEGYKTISADDGEEAIEKAVAASPDLIILDIMLPGKDGLEVLREIRKHPNAQNIPVIFLTAKDSEFDEVLGLELGADDYIVKPISMRKLLARVKNALRKSVAQPALNDKVIVVRNIEIDPASYQVKVSGEPVGLTKKEFDILYYLAKRPGRVITRKILLDEIWGTNVIVIDRTIDVHIRKIREKLGKDNIDLIVTIKGVGYRFKKAEQE
ncbi:DNA-binding response regulator [candidate division KSB1 bacterium RBG_16_48_16]|nr:MAG: DNA-binding response regulator [candidate division KSB1 bacterium RBG_16_48_16]